MFSGRKTVQDKSLKNVEKTTPEKVACEAVETAGGVGGLEDPGQEEMAANNVRPHGAHNGEEDSASGSAVRPSADMPPPSPPRLRKQRTQLESIQPDEALESNSPNALAKTERTDWWKPSEHFIPNTRAKRKALASTDTFDLVQPDKPCDPKASPHAQECVESASSRASSAVHLPGGAKRNAERDDGIQDKSESDTWSTVNGSAKSTMTAGGKVDSREDNKGEVEEQRCWFKDCPRPCGSCRYYTIREGCRAGGKDWSGLEGRVLCDACYCCFTRAGTLERLGRDKATEQSKGGSNQACKEGSSCSSKPSQRAGSVAQNPVIHPKPVTPTSGSLTPGKKGAPGPSEENQEGYWVRHKDGSRSWHPAPAPFSGAPPINIATSSKKRKAHSTTSKTSEGETTARAASSSDAMLRQGQETALKKCWECVRGESRHLHVSARACRERLGHTGPDWTDDPREKKAHAHAHAHSKKEDAVSGAVRGTPKSHAKSHAKDTTKREDQMREGEAREPHKGALAKVLFDDGRWYVGMLTECSGGKWHVVFEDGDEDDISLPDPDVQLLPPVSAALPLGHTRRPQGGAAARDELVVQDGLAQEGMVVARKGDGKRCVSFSRLYQTLHDKKPSSTPQHHKSAMSMGYAYLEALKQNTAHVFKDVCNGRVNETWLLSAEAAWLVVHLELRAGRAHEGPARRSQAEILRAFGARVKSLDVDKLAKEFGVHDVCKLAGDEQGGGKRARTVEVERKRRLGSLDAVRGHEQGMGRDSGVREGGKVGSRQDQSQKEGAEPRPEEQRCWFKDCRVDSREDNKGEVEEQRCWFKDCPRPCGSCRYYTIREGCRAGGKDWSGLEGRVLCDACYCCFTRAGTLERLGRDKATEQSKGGVGDAHNGCTKAHKGGSTSSGCSDTHMEQDTKVAALAKAREGRRGRGAVPSRRGDLSESEDEDSGGSGNCSDDDDDSDAGGRVRKATKCSHRRSLWERAEERMLADAIAISVEEQELDEQGRRRFVPLPGTIHIQVIKRVVGKTFTELRCSEDTAGWGFDMHADLTTAAQDIAAATAQKTGLDVGRIRVFSCTYGYLPREALLCHCRVGVGVSLVCFVDVVP